MASGRASSNQVGVTKDVWYVVLIVMAINPGVSSRLLLLNQQSYSYGAWFIASTVDSDYLQPAALWTQLQTWMADLKTEAIHKVSRLLSYWVLLKCLGPKFIPESKNE